MRTIRKRLSYANVVSTLALFLVLTGGAAYAANKLGHRSVGSAQLKSNAVTTAKIKANAVTTRKIKKIAISGDKLKDGAVTTEKLADGAVNEEKIDLDSVPFARVVARMRSLGTLSLEAEPQVFPLDTSSYTQAGNELDSFAGEVKITIPAKCTAPRAVGAEILVDPKNPKEPTEDEIFAARTLNEISGSGAVSTTLELQPGPSQVLFEPGSPTRHTVDLAVSADCAGGGGGVAASSGQVDVIATK